MKSKTKLTDRLAAAENDLAAATDAVAHVSSREGDASETAAAFAAWQSELAAAENEVKRLKLLVAKITGEIEGEASRAAEAAQKKLEVEADQAAERASDQIKQFFATFGPKVHALLRVIAEAETLVERVNRGRKDGAELLRGPEERARYRAGEAAKIISERTVHHWVYQRTGAIIDPANVPSIVTNDGVTGALRGGSSMFVHGGDTRVEKRAFREIVRRPAIRATLPDPLAMTLKVPALTGDRPLWEPPRYYMPSTVIERLDALEASQAPQLEPEVELIPLAADYAAA